MSSDLLTLISHHDLGRYQSEIPGLQDETTFRRFAEAFAAQVAKPSPLGCVPDYFEAIAMAEVIGAATCVLSEPNLHPDLLNAYAVRLQRYRGQLEYLAVDNDFRQWVGRVAALEQLSLILRAANAAGIDTEQLTVGAGQQPADSPEDPHEARRRSLHECEARLVALRVDYTPAQMRAECPSVTAFLRDVPCRDQIVTKTKAPPLAAADTTTARSATLGDFLHHPDLFLACPELATLPVRLFNVSTLNDGALAAYRENENGCGWIEVALSAPEKNLRGAVMGAVQRAIQRL
jgi:hypothetical protein